MVTRERLMTAEELLRLPTGMGKRYELIRGRLITMSPAGSRHGKIAGKAYLKVAAHAEKHRLGETFAAETGFRLESDPDTVRAPDVAFVAKNRIPTSGLPEGYFPGPPDLAVEVVSPDDPAAEVQEKVETFLAAGTRLVWVLYPRTCSVVVYQLSGAAQTLRAGDMLDGEEVLPGFSIRVGELFE